MLKRVFEDILKNKQEWLMARKGEQFEDIFESSLKKNGFNRIQANDKDMSEILKYIKVEIQNKLGEHVLENRCDSKAMKSCFVRSPYGSQDFPDFLIFTESNIVAVEIKYSSSNSVHPVWNSNLPKANAIYIFGSYGLSDVTFFLGRDVLTMEERILLIDFFESVKKLELKFKLDTKKSIKLGEFDRGFNVYIRRAYEQNHTINKNASVNYFRHSERLHTEANVIKFCETL